MNNITLIIGMVLLSFLSGSIPFGYIIAKVFYKKDITTLGSGNYGATNVLRMLGKLPGSITLILDTLKGYLPTAYSIILFKNEPLWPCIIGIVSIMGHTFNPFFKFKGGKGVATGFGMFIALTPVPVAIALLTFIATVFFTRYVSIGSMLGAVMLAVSTVFFYDGWSTRIVAILAAVLILLKHHTNIKRLIDGTENKITFKKE